MVVGCLTGNWRHSLRAENDMTRATFNEKFKMQTSEPSFSFASCNTSTWIFTQAGAGTR